MRKGIIWALRTGLSIRSVINNHGCNHVLVHLFKNGESNICSTYLYDEESIKKEDEFFDQCSYLNESSDKTNKAKGDEDGCM